MTTDRGNDVGDPLLDVDGVCRKTGLARQTIYNKVHRGEIPHVKLDGALRFRLSSIEKWIDERAVDAP